MFWWTLSGILSYFSVPFLLPVFQNNRRENYLEEAVPTGLGTAFVLSGALLIIARSREERYAHLLLTSCSSLPYWGCWTISAAKRPAKGFAVIWQAEACPPVHSRPGEDGGLTCGSGGFRQRLVPTCAKRPDYCSDSQLLNLLDVRPGRAGKVFLILGFPLSSSELTA